MERTTRERRYEAAALASALRHTPTVAAALVTEITYVLTTTADADAGYMSRRVAVDRLLDAAWNAPWCRSFLAEARELARRE